MPEEPTTAECGVTAPAEPDQENQEDGSRVRDLEPDSTPNRMKRPAGIWSTCLFRVSNQRDRED